MALLGLFGNDRTMAGSTYAGRESATDRRARKQAQRDAAGHDAAVKRHRRSATKLDRTVAAREDQNGHDDNAPGRRGRGWW